MMEYDRYVKKRYSIGRSKKKFAQFIKDNDMGLALYQANSTFTEWEKIEKNGNTTPCN